VNPVVRRAASSLTLTALLLVASPLLAVETTSGGCGDPTGNGEVTAGDALYVLQAATGLHACLPASCDVDSSGQVTASDALSVLETAVSPRSSLSCPTPTTTSSVTSSTGDECFDDKDCGDGLPYCCGYHCCECDGDGQCGEGLECVGEACVPATTTSTTLPPGYMTLTGCASMGVECWLLETTWGFQVSLPGGFLAGPLVQGKCYEVTGSWGEVSYCMQGPIFAARTIVESTEDCCAE
jgi:hypothetical protein